MDRILLKYTEYSDPHESKNNADIEKVPKYFLLLICHRSNSQYLQKESGYDSNDEIPNVSPMTQLQMGTSDSDFMTADAMGGGNYKMVPGQWVGYSVCFQQSSFCQLIMLIA